MSQDDSTGAGSSGGNGIRLGVGRWSLRAWGMGLFLVGFVAVGALVLWSESRTSHGRDVAVGTISAEHRDLAIIARASIDETRRLACLLSLDQGERVWALRSGDPCAYLLAVPERRPR